MEQKKEKKNSLSDKRLLTNKKGLLSHNIFNPLKEDTPIKKSGSIRKNISKNISVSLLNDKLKSKLEPNLSIFKETDKKKDQQTHQLIQKSKRKGQGFKVREPKRNTIDINTKGFNTMNRLYNFGLSPVAKKKLSLLGIGVGSSMAGTIAGRSIYDYIINPKLKEKLDELAEEVPELSEEIYKSNGELLAFSKTPLLTKLLIGGAVGTLGLGALDKYYQGKKNEDIYGPNWKNILKNRYENLKKEYDTNDIDKIDYNKDISNSDNKELDELMNTDKDIKSFKDIDTNKFNSEGILYNEEIMNFQDYKEDMKRIDNDNSINFSNEKEDYRTKLYKNINFSLGKEYLKSQKNNGKINKKLLVGLGLGTAGLTTLGINNALNEHNKNVKLQEALGDKSIKEVEKEYNTQRDAGENIIRANRIQKELNDKGYISPKDLEEIKNLNIPEKKAMEALMKNGQIETGFTGEGLPEFGKDNLVGDVLNNFSLQKYFNQDNFSLKKKLAIGGAALLGAGAGTAYAMKDLQGNEPGQLEKASSKILNKAGLGPETKSVEGEKPEQVDINSLEAPNNEKIIEGMPKWYKSRFEELEPGSDEYKKAITDYLEEQERQEGLRKLDEVNKQLHKQYIPEIKLNGIIGDDHMKNLGLEPNLFSRSNKMKLNFSNRRQNNSLTNARLEAVTEKYFSQFKQDDSNERAAITFNNFNNALGRKLRSNIDLSGLVDAKIRNFSAKDKLKKAGLVTAGVAATAGTALGAKHIMDLDKKIGELEEVRDQLKSERDTYEQMYENKVDEVKDLKSGLSGFGEKVDQLGGKIGGIVKEGANKVEDFLTKNAPKDMSEVPADLGGGNYSMFSRNFTDKFLKVYGKKYGKQFSNTPVKKETTNFSYADLGRQLNNPKTVATLLEYLNK